MTKKFN